MRFSEWRNLLDRPSYPCSTCELLTNQRRILDLLESLLKKVGSVAENQASKPGTLEASAARRFLTVKEAATELRLRESTLRLWIGARRIASVHLGRRVVIPITELERLVSKGLTPSAGAESARRRSYRAPAF
jgi:excisionase family DNA binding protein